jgi:3-deoxy-manno-octulosonate cytidylyltransferase (CMP-KDO synthetase)
VRGNGGEAKENSAAVPQRIVGIIPARYDSTRLPGKLLAMLGERTVLRHVYDRACRARELDHVVVATDDDRILREVLAFGGTAVMTSRSHRSGTDRIAEAVDSMDETADLLVNIQGDEPFCDPAAIDAVAVALRSDPDSLWTAASVLEDEEVLSREDVVKAVVASDGRVLYFSRAVVPHVRGCAKRSALHRHHVGLYGYSRRLLRYLAQIPPSPLEEAEALEQLRALEAGIVIRAVTVAAGFGGIDTREDLERARRLLAQGGA